MGRESGRPHVVVVGAGFGGLEAARALADVPVDLTVVDRHNFHLFQPLLYQVATGGLSPGDIASPIRWVLRKNPRARVLMGEVVDFDVEGRAVRLADGERIPYDFLVLATGATHHYFGNDGWSEHAPGLKTVSDALEIRRRVFRAFERAERAPAKERDALLTFVVAGGGPTGVELAGALADLAHDTLPTDFRAIDPQQARILLVEGEDRVLGAYPEDLSRKALDQLEDLGVEVRLETLVRHVDASGVELERDGERERVEAATVLWGAGVKASPLGDTLARAADVGTEKDGRLRVGEDCSLPGRPEIFVIGDLARFDQDGEPVPGVAPVAMQQGRHVARVVADRLAGRPGKAFRYKDRGSLATIGRSAAVADFGRLRFAGLPAWLLWTVVHIAFLVEFENRVLVMIQWAWSYFTRNRGARLIVGGVEDLRHEERPPSDA